MASDRECPLLQAEKSSTIAEPKVEKFYPLNRILSDKLCKITRSKDYKAFYGAGFFATHFFVIYYLPAEVNFNYGITVTKKIGNAVARNKFKRIIRSLIRSYVRDNCLRPFKINITAKRSLVNKSFASISQDFRYAMNKVYNNV